MLSVEHVAKELLFLQSTSRVGAANLSTMKEEYIPMLLTETNTKGKQRRSQCKHSTVPEWNSNCCLHSHVLVSQTIAVLSTLPLRRQSPFLFHFKEKIGPLCLIKVFFNSPVHVSNLTKSKKWQPQNSINKNYLTGNKYNQLSINFACYC